MYMLDLSTCASHSLPSKLAGWKSSTSQLIKNHKHQCLLLLCQFHLVKKCVRVSLLSQYTLFAHSIVRPTHFYGKSHREGARCNSSNNRKLPHYKNIYGNVHSVDTSINASAV